MATVLARLPERQLAPLLSAYAAATRARQVRTLIVLAIMGVCVCLAWNNAGVDLERLWDGIERFTSYFDRLFKLDSGARVWTDPGEWLWGWSRWLRLLGDTILIAYVGTVLGAAGAFLLCFAAARNLDRAPWLRFSIRRFLEFCRTVPDLVFALVFVVAFGLGPVPGVLAIAIHSLGALGKLFFEIVENIDMAPVSGLQSTGASFPLTVRFAVVPQVLASFASYALLRFEINVRGATVMGFVGAGGIGQDLIESIRKFYYADVSAILVMIVIAVFALDIATERLRRGLTNEPRR